ncbi:MAG: hypothetical protein IKQ39_06360 [Oscillospiraceae bacterium]|nr:hypothetical protein [Oscillospiraceae bacterium]
MALFDRAQQQSLLYNYPAWAVFQAMCGAAQVTSGFTLIMANPQLLTIQISKSMSIFTWGENLFAQVFPLNETQSNLQIICKSKLGTEIAANSQNRKDIEKILGATQQQLMLMFGANPPAPMPPQNPYMG